jgi:phosphate-selective porin OprO/OprP
LRACHEGKLIMTVYWRAPGRIACGALAAALLCSASTAALAAPGRAPRSPPVTQEQLQRVLDELRAERDARQAAEAQIQALTDRLGTLESATQVVTTQAGTVENLASQVEALNAAPTVSVSNGRPTFATRDGAFSIALRANVMVDAGAYFQDSPGPLNTDLRRGAGSGDTARARDLNSGAVFRRARLGMEGRVFKDFTYNLTTEFGGSGTEDAGRLYEMWVQYNGIPNVAIRAGAFEPQNGLGSNVSTSNILIMERPAVSEITRNIAGGDTRTAIQVQRFGEFGSDSGFGGSYVVSAAFTGSPPSSVNSAGGFAVQPFGEQRGLTGRVVVAPSPSPQTMFHVGLNGSYVISPADVLGPDANGVNPPGSNPVQFRDRPELRLDATRLIDTGSIDADHAWHWGVEGSFQYSNFFIQGEYQQFGIDRRNSALSNPRFSGWWVEGSWILTGETRRWNAQNGVYDAPSITNPWQPGSGGYGAFELGVRYSTVDLNYNAGAPLTAIPADGIRGGEQSVIAVGLNWYVNSNLRFMLDLLHVDVDRLAPSANFGGGTYPAGSRIGQAYNAVALRTQFGF